MRSDSPFRNKNGFTLVEIIASIALLGMVIGVMLPIFPQLMNWSSQSEDQLTTSNLLGRVVEDVESNAGAFDTSEVKGCKNGDLIEVQSDKPAQYQYEVNDRTYHTEFEMCREEEVNLFRTKIRIMMPEGKHHSETYTYIKAGGQS